MRSYTSFRKIYIGASDIGSLIFRSANSLKEVHFGASSYYEAYECFGDDVEIDKQFKVIFKGDMWLKIYDDNWVTYDRSLCNDMKKITVYHNDTECIIHWHN